MKMAMMNARKSWIQWLNENPARKVYDDHPDKVKSLLGGSDNVSKFKKLTESKNIVLLSRKQIGVKLQATFFHSTVGEPIIPEDMHFVALSGMKHGKGVELDPTSLFKSSPFIDIPSTLESKGSVLVGKFIS